MKFKNRKELTSYIFMNLFGAPFTWVIAYVFLNWYGVIGCLSLFFICFKLYKYFGEHKDAKLSISPGFTFGTKNWTLFN